MLGRMSGLDYLHTRIPPIRHRDLKPFKSGNILFHRDPKLRKVVPIIIDFGISKQFLDSHWTTVSGTEQYKAPEQIPDDGRKYEDKILSLTTDIFSLGCCFALMEAVLRGKPSPRDVDERAVIWRDNITEVNELLHQERLKENATYLEDFCFNVRKVV